VSEERVQYVLKPDTNSVTLSTEMDTLRAQLVDVERQLLSLLVTVQRALGKEPSVMTRAERRRG
jgi:hypothetical protein